MTHNRDHIVIQKLKAMFASVATFFRNLFT